MKTIYTAIIILLSCSLSYNQSIKDNQIEVMKEFNSEIYSANPINNAFDIRVPQRQEIEFSNDSLMALDNFNPNLTLDIKPLSYQEQKATSYKNGYAQINKGTLNAWNGDIVATHRVDNYFSIDGTAHYDKWQNNQIIDQYTENMKAQLGMKYYLTDKLLSTIKVGGQKSQFGNYAFNTVESNTSRDTITTNNYQGEFGLRSFNSKPKSFNFSLNGIILHSSFNELANETIWTITPEVSQNINKNWRIVNETQYTKGTLDNTAAVYTLANNFNIKYNSDKWSQSFGLSYAKTNDEQSYFPLVTTNLTVSNDLRLSMRLNQEIDYQGLHATIQQNPFIDFQEFIPNAALKQSLTIAAESRLSKSTTFNLEVSYNQYSNAQNYSNIQAQLSLFTPDLVDYKALSFRSQINYTYSDHLDAGLSLIYHKFEHEETLFHKPSTLAKPYIDIHTSNKKVSGKIWGTFNTKQNLYRDSEDQIVQSGIRKDLSAELSINLWENINVRLNGDNLLNDDFEVLGGLSTFGRNVSGGILIKF